MNALNLVKNIANKAIKSVPAYKNFLRSQKVRVSKVVNWGTFKRLPIMDKKNYLYEYKLPQLFPNSHIAPMAYASSGSSGRPTFWFRGDQQEKIAGDIHEKILADIYGIKKTDSTLVVICFSMGVWVAGNYTLSAFREVARRGYNLTVITPGIDRLDIYSSLKSLTSNFKNLVIAGYPPFVMDVVNEAVAQKIYLPKNTKILTAGDKFSEGWRDQIMSILGLKKTTDVITIYGCADVGALGVETPASIYIRRTAVRNPQLYTELFGDEEITPALVQYNPEHIFFEEINSELVFSVNSAIPLVRYNIHDVGTILTHHQMSDILRQYNIKFPDNINHWDWPYIIKKGRTDVAVTFYALNIYPEHLTFVLKDKYLLGKVNGNYLVFNKDANNHRTQELHLELELKAGQSSSAKIVNNIQKIFVKRLMEVNIEYRKLVGSIGKRAYPIIKLKPESVGILINKHSGLLAVSGKKPKVIL